MVDGRFHCAAKVTSNWCSNLLLLLPVLISVLLPFQTFNFCCCSVRGWFWWFCRRERDKWGCGDGNKVSRLEVKVRIRGLWRMELGVGYDCGVFSSAVLRDLKTGQYGLSGSTTWNTDVCAVASDGHGKLPLSGKLKSNLSGEL
jgi:hypothetical protein